MTHGALNPVNRRGFSLVELVLACALLVILLAAGRGAIGLAKNAARSPVLERSISLSAALDDLTNDVGCALQIQTVTAKSISAFVPDRNGDGEDDLITYSWSGAAGAPLIRSINGGTPETLVASLQSFAIASSQQTISVPAPAAKSTERLVGGNSTSSSLKTTTISASNFRAGSFVPANLPAGTTSWKLTRVRVMVRQNPPVVGAFSVQVQPTNAQAPSGQVLEEVSIAESDISSSYAWKDVTFSTLDKLSPINPIAIVVTRLSPSIEPCDLQATGSGGATVAGNAYFSSSNSGASWSMVSGEDMIYAVYGIPNVPTSTTTATGLSSLQITAVPTSGAAIHMNIPASNIPQM
ncbi:MAG: prepilin-type N-terminal cleavage/methylation domain-containing protein [Phycisphaeraceae bacterium]|nr:prepilin-type N-terminal cleavage/methylation domain-containing protein [Phycisphaeraceae bacterium]